MDNDKTKGWHRPMLTEEEIRYWSTNAVVYQRGVDLYRMGAVPKLQVVQEGNLCTVRGYVEGSSGDMYYNLLEVNTDNPDDVYFECECPAAHKYEGACKHTVAVMLKLMEMERRGTLQVHHVDKVCGNALLDYYEQALMESMEEVRCGYIRVEPKLVEIGEGEFGLALSVGEERMYVVKHMDEFVQQIVKEEQTSYGKNLMFVHRVEAFTQACQPLIRFVIEQQMDRNNTLGQVYGGRMHGVEKKLLVLSPGGFDKLFDLYKGSEIAFQDERGNMTIQCIEEDPSFVFQIEESNGEFTVYTTTKHYQIIDHPLHQYIWSEDKFYRVSKRFGRRVLPVLKYMQEVYPPQLKFDETGFKRFSATILNQLRKYAVVRLEDYVLQNYTPPELTIKLYLDKDQKHEVVGRVVYDYEGYQFNPFDHGVDVKVARDIEKEHHFNLLLEQYGFRAKKGELYLEEEALIYGLLTTGVQAFLEVSEVHVTDQLRDMRIKEAPIGSIGIKLKSSLLEIDLKEFHMSPEEIEDVIQAYRQKKKYYRLTNGAFIDLMNEEMELLSELTDTLNIKEADFERGVFEVGKYRALYLEKLLKKSGTIQVKKDKGMKEMVRHIGEVGESDEELPRELEASLRGYQKTGYLWLYTMAQYGFGGILADDMGLGKTLQVITLLLKEKEKGESDKPSLVVAPTSLVLNWEKELQKFAPTLKSLVLNGGSVERKEKLTDREGIDVIITSYDVLKRDKEQYEDIAFKYCIADEAHYIKNPNTQNAKAIKAIQSEVNFALTGTPIENALSELWSLFDFCMPGYLYNYHQFKASFETPIMRMMDTRAMGTLQRMIAPFVLRRLKKDVLKELPPKTETILYNKMEEAQETLYNAHLALVQKELSRELEAHGFGKSHMKILAMLTRLRQLCCHPGLYLEDYKGESSKLSQCMELVTECVEGGHKMLIFSQFTSMLDRIGESLRKENIDYYSLTGQTKTSRRMEMVENFNKDNVPVFLISLKAGGTGLNLTGADVVIHYDPWWNVSSEHQATDRVYRIGQENPVQVFKLITENSIEEKIKALQDKKIHLAENLLKEGETFINSLSEQEIKELFA